MGKRGQAAGWGCGARGCPGAADASAQARAAGTWPAIARPGRGPSEPGWGCILGPLAQRSRRLTHRTSDSARSGHTNRTGHQHGRPHSSHAQHPTSHLRAPARHVTPTVQCHTPHTGIPHKGLDFTHLGRFTPLTPRAGKGRPGGVLHSRSLPARTHLLPHASPLPEAVRPPPFPAVQTSDFFSRPSRRKAACPRGRTGGAAAAGGPTLPPCPTRWPGKGRASGVRRSTNPAGF